MLSSLVGKTTNTMEGHPLVIILSSPGMVEVRRPLYVGLTGENLWALGALVNDIKLDAPAKSAKTRWIWWHDDRHPTTDAAEQYWSVGSNLLAHLCKEKCVWDCRKEFHALCDQLASCELDYFMASCFLLLGSATPCHLGVELFWARFAVNRGWTREFVHHFHYEGFESFYQKNQQCCASDAAARFFWDQVVLAFPEHSFALAFDILRDKCFDEYSYVVMKKFVDEMKTFQNPKWSDVYELACLRGNFTVASLVWPCVPAAERDPSQVLETWRDHEGEHLFEEEDSIQAILAHLREVGALSRMQLFVDSALVEAASGAKDVACWLAILADLPRGPTWNLIFATAARSFLAKGAFFIGAEQAFGRPAISGAIADGALFAKHWPFLATKRKTRIK